MSPHQLKVRHGWLYHLQEVQSCWMFGPKSPRFLDKVRRLRWGVSAGYLRACLRKASRPGRAVQVCAGLLLQVSGFRSPVCGCCGESFPSHGCWQQRCLGRNCVCLPLYFLPGTFERSSSFHDSSSRKKHTISLRNSETHVQGPISDTVYSHYLHTRYHGTMFR